MKLVNSAPIQAEVAIIIFGMNSVIMLQKNADPGLSAECEQKLVKKVAQSSRWNQTRSGHL